MLKLNSKNFWGAQNIWFSRASTLKKTIIFLPNLIHISLNNGSFQNVSLIYFFNWKKIAFQWFVFQSKTSFYSKAKSLADSNSYRKDMSTIPYNSYRRNIRGSIALALDPQLIFIQTLIPKLKWIPSSMGRKRMVACTSMEVFAWVTQLRQVWLPNQYVLCSIFYWKNVIFVIEKLLKL